MIRGPGQRMRSLGRRILDAAVLDAMVLVSWVVFEIERRSNPRFKRALEFFEAVYQFRAGSRGKRLVFSGGKVSVRAGLVPSPDYEIAILDPMGVVRQMMKGPNDMLRLLLENKIDQRGNNYYLFKYGYLWGLVGRRIRDLSERFAPRSARQGSPHGA